MNYPTVSVIVPLQSDFSLVTRYLIPALKTQRYTDFELILVADNGCAEFNQISFIKIVICKGGPATKRDYGASRSKGKILAFIDSDAYPMNDYWLMHAVHELKSKSIAAVCGPGITPPNSTMGQVVSGLVWSNFLGSGGAGIYRNSIQKRRYVDDFPSFNFIINKIDFDLVNGFNTQYWPGEDTFLCHEIVSLLDKKIVYEPSVAVYHHRRPLLIPHLVQVSRFGVHRGYFSKILPKTSRKIGYIIPSIFTLYLFCLPVLLLNSFWSLIPIVVYLLLLFGTSIITYVKNRNFVAALMLAPSIFVTHVVYGAMFIKGMFVSNLLR
jgi:glycosyltransferase involved in cell wall biosynthesis